VRIAVAQLSAEGNSFVELPCPVEFFEQTGYVREGDDVLALADTSSEVAGFLEAIEAAGAEPVPLLAARGNSCGPLLPEAWSSLRDRLLTRLEAAGRVDGVLVSLHGSLLAQDEHDPEGALLSAIRARVGDAPIVASLDLHANVTARMTNAATALVGYRHYPHDDTLETGRRAGELLTRTVAGEIEPVMQRAAVPMLLSAFHSMTPGRSPFDSLMQSARAEEARPGVLVASPFLVGSYIDVAEIGCSIVAVADGDRPLAAETAQRLADRFWSSRHEYAVDPVTVAEAVARAGAVPGHGPFLLLDTADTTGGGAAGDGIGAVRGLLDAAADAPSLATVVDPAAAAACHAAGAGAQLTLDVGHALDPRWGRPLRLTGTVDRLLDGRLRYSGGILGGSEVSMGPSAVLAVGALRLLISTTATYEWRDEQYRQSGLDPAAARFVAVKNMMNFRLGYGEIMRGHAVLDLPGPTPADLRSLSFAQVPASHYPFDERARP
jgi:microcystin degradation protein MlrC